MNTLEKRVNEIFQQLDKNNDDKKTVTESDDEDEFDMNQSSGSMDLVRSKAPSKLRIYYRPEFEM